MNTEINKILSEILASGPSGIYFYLFFSHFLFNSYQLAIQKAKRLISNVDNLKNGPEKDLKQFVCNEIASIR